VVAFGAAGFNHASKGYGAGPTKALKRNLSRYCTVVNTDEFRSSKLCSDCCAPLTEQSADGAVLGWGVRRCVNTECSTSWWHRDVNAARNIGRTFLLGQTGHDLPAAFRRTAGVDPVDEAAMAAAMAAVVSIGETSTQQDPASGPLPRPPP
jgi:hypothetical protein